MTRLFAGTPWDRPPTCERCGKLESECTCPPPLVAPVRLAPESQTARLRLEKRPRGKVVTVVANLDPAGNAQTIRLGNDPLYIGHYRSIEGRVLSARAIFLVGRQHRRGARR